MTNFNYYMKNIAFKFHVYCVCGKKKQIDHIQKYYLFLIDSTLKAMQSIMKFDIPQHDFDNETQIPIQLKNNMEHIYIELQGLLLCKDGISNHEKAIYICKTCFYSIKQNKLPKFSLANALWIGNVKNVLPNLTVEETLIAHYRCRIVLIKLRYSSNIIMGQSALKGNIISFSQNPEEAIKLIKKLPISLETLSDAVAVHFVGTKHPPSNIIKSYKLLYVCRFVVLLWLTWLQANHLGYKDICIDSNKINILPKNSIPKSILQAIFKSEDTDMANTDYRTNISNLYVPTESTPKFSENIKTTFESSGLVDLDGVNITKKEMMSSAISNLKTQKYFSYTHGSYSINEYNNPHLITCMFPSLFPYGIGAPKLQHRIVKILLNLENENHKFSTHNLFQFFIFNLIQ